jgi:hypothetical protein
MIRRTNLHSPPRRLSAVVSKKWHSVPQYLVILKAIDATPGAAGRSDSLDPSWGGWEPGAEGSLGRKGAWGVAHHSALLIAR